MTPMWNLIINGGLAMALASMIGIIWIGGKQKGLYKEMELIELRERIQKNQLIHRDRIAKLEREVYELKIKLKCVEVPEFLADRRPASLVDFKKESKQ